MLYGFKCKITGDCVITSDDTLTAYSFLVTRYGKVYYAKLKVTYNILENEDENTDPWNINYRLYRHERNGKEVLLEKCLLEGVPTISHLIALLNDDISKCFSERVAFPVAEKLLNK